MMIDFDTLQSLSISELIDVALATDNEPHFWIVTGFVVSHIYPDHNDVIEDLGQALYFGHPTNADLAVGALRKLKRRLETAGGETNEETL